MEGSEEALLLQKGGMEKHALLEAVWCLGLWCQPYEAGSGTQANCQGRKGENGDPQHGFVLIFESQGFMNFTNLNIHE